MQQRNLKDLKGGNNHEMKVEASSEIKTTLVFETEKHVFKIGDEALKKLTDKENPIYHVSSKIQKSMKQKVDECTGTDWEQSYKAILKHITKQETL